MSIGRTLVQVIELGLQKLYGMRDVSVAVVEVLKEVQKKCREILLEVLEGTFDEDEDL